MFSRGHPSCWPVRAFPPANGPTLTSPCLRGAGPVLALTAGVHGYEFPPILAGQQLLTRIDPGRLAGTVILVRLAHVAAFEHRVPYVNPFDRRNLNRVFPGKADGTQTEHIAWVLTREVIRRSDLHVELHSGDGAEWLEAFAGIYGGRLAAAQYARSRDIGLAFGLQNIVKYSMETQAQVDSGRSLNRQAVADGKPTVLIEIGENGRRDASFVDAIVKGVDNLLRVLKMMPRSLRPNQRTAIGSQTMLGRDWSPRTMPPTVSSAHFQEAMTKPMPMPITNEIP